MRYYIYYKRSSILLHRNCSVEEVRIMTDRELQTTRGERISYGIYFFGQNLLWSFAGLVSTFLLDIGLDAKVASAVLLGPKIWDAVNDTLFGYIVDKTEFRGNRKFIPWVRLGTMLIGVSTVFMFAINSGIGKQWVKIAWFLIAYIIFDCAYTMLDAPMYALPTVMTTNIKERTGLISSNRFGGIMGGLVGTLLVPVIRPKLGWFFSAVVICLISTLFMLPILFLGKERTVRDQSGEEYGLKQMFGYIGKNRYLTISLLLIFIVGVCSIETTLSLLMARNCLGDESLATLVTAVTSLPMIFTSLLIPRLSRKYDKRSLLIFGMITALIGSVGCYLAGYGSIVMFFIPTVIRGIGYSFFMVISYMLIADSVEYGTYKTGVRASGISFSLQTFTAKLKNAVIGSVALFALGLFGYDSSIGETAVQSVRVANGIWTVFNLLPAIGYAVALVLLIFFYKLRNPDVEVMARYNSGEISREEAESLLEERFGKAGR